MRAFIILCLLTLTLNPVLSIRSWRTEKSLISLAQANSRSRDDGKTQTQVVGVVQTTKKKSCGCPKPKPCCQKKKCNRCQRKPKPCCPKPKPCCPKPKPCCKHTPHNRYVISFKYNCKDICKHGKNFSCEEKKFCEKNCMMHTEAVTSLVQQHAVELAALVAKNYGPHGATAHLD